MQVQVGYKYRIKPNPTQAEFLSKCFGCSQQHTGLVLQQYNTAGTAGIYVYGDNTSTPPHGGASVVATPKKERSRKFCQR